MCLKEILMQMRPLSFVFLLVLSNLHVSFCLNKPNKYQPNPEKNQTKERQQTPSPDLNINFNILPSTVFLNKEKPLRQPGERPGGCSTRTRTSWVVKMWDVSCASPGMTCWNSCPKAALFIWVAGGRLMCHGHPGFRHKKEQNNEKSEVFFFPCYCHT